MSATAAQEPEASTGELQLGEVVVASPLHTPAMSQLTESPLPPPPPPSSSLEIDKMKKSTATSEVITIDDDSQTATPGIKKCLNKPDSFCYICGRPTFVKTRRKTYATLIEIYEAYYNRKITDLNEWWTPSCFCSSCTGQLYNWDNGRLASGMTFAVPMIWRKPADDHSDCYFCTVPKSVIFSGIKNRKAYIYPEPGTTCVDTPIDHSDEYPIPERIITPVVATSIATSTTTTTTTTTDEDSCDGFITQYEHEQQLLQQQGAKKPELFTPEDLECFLKNLSPLNQEQKKLLTSVLYLRNLVAPIVCTTRARTSGKRKSYVFAAPSPKRLRPRAAHHHHRPEDHDDDEATIIDDPDEDGNDNDDTEDADFMEDDDLPDSETPNDDDDDDSDYEVHDSLLKRKFEKIITVSLRCLVDDCTIVVRDKKELDTHLAAIHLVQKHRCLVLSCRASFKTLREFRGHLNRHHPEVVSYPCGRCLDRSYKDYYGLKKHIYENHLLGHFRCGYPDCDFEEPSGLYSKMTAHQKRVHVEKHLQCPFEGCPRAFFTQCALDRHEKTHTGEKLFDCTYCGKSFATDKERATHTRSHTGDLPFVCHICGKAYPRKGTLQKHLTLHKAPEHHCEVCGKVFTWEDSLKKHMNLHLGIKPHECPNCGKRFTWPSNLAKHRRNQVCTAGDGRKMRGSKSFQLDDDGSGNQVLERIEVIEVQEVMPENIHLIPELQFQY